MGSTRQISVRAVDVVAGIAWAVMVGLWLSSRFIDLNGYLSDTAIIVLMVAGVLTIRAGMMSVRDALVNEFRRPEREAKLLREVVNRR